LTACSDARPELEVAMGVSSTEASPCATTLRHAAADPLRLFVESVKDCGIFMLDPAGIVVSWNPGAEELKKY